MTFELLDGKAALAHAEEFEALSAEVYADLPADAGTDGGRVAEGFRVQCRQPGFALAAARSGGYLVGFAAGLPLRPSTSWWRDLTTSLPAKVTAEHAGRTFALTSLLVRASWRRQGIGRSVYDLLLASRGEERATAVVSPAASAAQAAFRNWGWDKVARARNPDPGMPALDVLVMALG